MALSPYAPLGVTRYPGAPTTPSLDVWDSTHVEHVEEYLSDIYTEVTTLAESVTDNDSAITAHAARLDTLEAETVVTLQDVEDAIEARVLNNGDPLATHNEVGLQITTKLDGNGGSSEYLTRSMLQQEFAPIALKTEVDDPTTGLIAAYTLASEAVTQSELASQVDRIGNLETLTRDSAHGNEALKTALDALEARIIALEGA